MTQNRLLRTACLAVALFFLPCQSMGAPATGKPMRDIVLTMPAETVLASLKKVLPLTIPSQSSQLQGQIVLESLDTLTNQQKQELFKMGDKSIPISMEPVNITGTDNSLVFRLLPQVGTPN